MTIGSPPPIDPDRAKAILVVAEEHQRQRVSGFQDVAIVLGWLRRAIIWPVRLVLRIARRNHDDESPDEG